jgi:hypothetical protein
MFTTMQRQMIYYPAVAEERGLLDEAARLGLKPWRDGNGGLIGWRPASQGESGRRMVVFHGNAGFALHREYFVEGFRALGEGWEVFLFEYPGYGARSGSPSEEAIKGAATRAVELLLRRDARGGRITAGHALFQPGRCSRPPLQMASSPGCPE